MIIDFHTHTFPDAIAAPAIKKMQGDCHSAAFTEGTVSALQSSMAEAGMDYSVVLPVVTNPAKAGSINDISLKFTGKDGLIYFGGMHPDTPNWYEELGRIKDAGLKGIKIHPVYQHVDFDDPRYLRILDRAGELGLVVVTHAGDDIGFPGADQCAPQKIANALKQVGNVTLVAAHMGGWKRWQQAAELLAGFNNVYLDTSFSLGSIVPLGDGYYAEDDLWLLDEKEFCSMVQLFGSQRILFGTDSPWSNAGQSIKSILSLPLTDEEKQDILGRNASTLLQL